MLRFIVVWIALMLLCWALTWRYIMHKTRGYGIKVPPVLETLRPEAGTTKLLSDPTLYEIKSSNNMCVESCNSRVDCKGVIMTSDGVCRQFFRPSKMYLHQTVKYYDNTNRSKKTADGEPIIGTQCIVNDDCSDGTSCINGECIPEHISACRVWCNDDRRCIGVNDYQYDYAFVSNSDQSQCIPYRTYIPGDNKEVLNPAFDPLFG